MTSMLSRVADNLYWASRYLERAEHTARVADVNLNLALEQNSMDTSRWMRTIAALGFKAPSVILTEEDFTQWLLFDPDNHSSVVSSIMSARENARQVREQISSEMWEQLNRLFHQVKSGQAAVGAGMQPMTFLSEVRDGSHLFQGITDSTMNHGEGWQFIQLGRFIERACASATLLNCHFREFRQVVLGKEDHLEWIGLLKCLTAFESYCKVYTAEPQPEQIAEFLLLSAEFPHSIRFSVDAIQAAMKHLPGAPQRKGMGRPARLAGKLSASLNFSPIEEIMASGLNPYLEHFHRQCSEIHQAIHQVYVEYPVESAIEA